MSLWKYTPKHQTIFKNNILSGITLIPWLHILWARKAQISWRVYWLRVLILSALAIINSVLALIEKFRFGRAISAQTLHPRPVFILGHPRTGTTYLHSLLALDVESFHAPTTLQCGFPSAFLTIAPIKSLIATFVSKKRPMDNMKLSLDTPQEDELAVNVLTGGISPYMPLVFMTREPDFRSFFTFLDPAAAAAKQKWCAAFQYFLRKVTYQNDKSVERRLVIKSPVHTARVRLLLELFPEAQFIFIHRHPYDVFKSAANMADTTYWFSYLATPTDEQINVHLLLH